MLAGVLAFDIETHADWEALPEEVRRYLTERDAARGIGPEDRRAAARTAALLPGAAQVIAVGLWSEDPAERVCLSLAPGGGAAPGVLRYPSEEALLRAFWERASAVVAGGRRLVSFHGRGFDGPMLSLRSAVFGVRPSLQLVGRRGATRPHLDLAELLAFHGAQRERYSLAYWCGVFGVGSPKQELCGAEVGAAWEGGRHEAIERYALEDARAAGELFLRLRDTLLPLEEAAA
ncbi:MAG: 3'-5' exonuclease [Planctomycetota bacterium]